MAEVSYPVLLRQAQRERARDQAKAIEFGVQWIGTQWKIFGTRWPMRPSPPPPPERTACIPIDASPRCGARLRSDQVNTGRDGAARMSALGLKADPLDLAPIAPRTVVGPFRSYNLGPR